MADRQHVEMIIDYITSGTDYQYCDNHGILTRCRDCEYFEENEGNCAISGCYSTENDFCSWARRKKGQ